MKPYPPEYAELHVPLISIAGIFDPKTADGSPKGEIRSHFNSLKLKSIWTASQLFEICPYDPVWFVDTGIYTAKVPAGHQSVFAQEPSITNISGWPTVSSKYYKAYEMQAISDCFFPGLVGVLGSRNSTKGSSWWHEPSNGARAGLRPNDFCNNQGAKVLRPKIRQVAADRGIRFMLVLVILSKKRGS